MNLQASLTCCAILLVLPRSGFNTSVRAVVTCLLLFTLLSTTLLESVVAIPVLVAVTCVVAALHLTSQPRWWVCWRTVAVGAVASFFQHRMDIVYPFHRLYSIPFEWVEILMVGLALLCLTDDIAQVWAAWAVFYLGWALLDEPVVGVYQAIHRINWFWEGELLLQSFWLFKGIYLRWYAKNTRKIV
ncbi:hypothetical protein NZD89_14455 [Alicyclobacillus fastidiosus]|uniref:Uncharacterized protein n=1 Tax=Alicyclobacillus fastidiosus TaxID=392011 RepID=A0ABY6ZBZ3_9BACL|nr:hypothetical protein [Alicyclobacillus fastidiosus]WAH39620.1 hypothetical protein NZD89_14455 [Alicyclobacillus fastidiosus]GMA60827.1 hypothetical protein GCM10025859_12670 [Alicyclobacillus fastidiosus]